MTLEKTLQLSEKLLKIARVCTVVIGVLVVCSILILYYGNVPFGDTTAYVQLGVLRVNLTQAGMTEAVINTTVMPWSVAVIAGYCVIFYLALRELGKIVDLALQSSVFEKQISTGLNHLAWYVIAGGVINIIAVMMSVIRMNGMNLAALFNPSLVSGIQMQYTYDLGFLAVAFVLFLLSRVFAYGAQLQQLSDETL
ncbi:MAG: hypothetical protein ACI32N_02640 [Bulleidia sp.]